MSRATGSRETTRTLCPGLRVCESTYRRGEVNEALSWGGGGGVRVLL